MEMKSPIAQIYYGENGLQELIPQSEKYKKALSEVVKKDEEIREKWKNNPEALKLYDEFVWAKGNMQCEEVENHFVEGFRFGFLMALDVMGKFAE